MNRSVARLLAAAWLGCVAVVAWSQVQLWRNPPWDTDIMALLPRDRPASSRALQAMADAAAQQVLVVVQAPTWEMARHAAGVFVDTLQAAHAPLRRSALADVHAQDKLVQALRPYRRALLTDAQRTWLMHTPQAALNEQALAGLYQPTGGRMTPWLEDPLALWTAWWQARGRESPAQPRDGIWAAQHDGRDVAVLLLESTAPAFSLAQAGVLTEALERARCAAQAASVAQPEANNATSLQNNATTTQNNAEPATSNAIRIDIAGFPVHADAAAARANWEINTIGWGSLAAVLLLVWLAFRSLRPLLLVGLSLAIGCAAGLSATAWVFGRVHILTAVFGRTLVGVAEDFGIHYFASRQGHPASERWQVLAHHLPGLTMAMATSVLGYALMGLAPFPGLRQMALFSAVGIAAAFATVVCWFAWLDGGALPVTALSARIAGNLVRWPRWQRWWFVPVTVLLLTGLLRLHADDDVRSLQQSAPAVMAQQMHVGQVLNLPSPAQFFEVHGPDAETVLQREEALRRAVQPLLTAGHVSDLRATSRWLPSMHQQRRDIALVQAREAAAVAYVAQQLDETLAPPAPMEPLSLAAWQAAVGSASPVSGLWLGPVGDEVVSVVQVHGLHGFTDLLQNATAALPGVRWVDKTADISRLLNTYRQHMLTLLVACSAAIALLLWARFRQHAWRAALPTALACGLALATLGLVNQPLTLFAVLALLLVVGIGVDYGIFLLEDAGDGRAWVAVVMGAASTWLSFGLLGLSATPALRVFGLTTFFGVGWVWLLTPCFRKEAP